MNTPIVIQARCSSQRFPRKVLTEFLPGMPMIEFQVKRLSNIFKNVIVATSKEDSDNDLANFCHEKNIRCYRGSLNNVMRRLYEAAKSIEQDNNKIFFRVGGDDPLISPEGILFCIKEHKRSLKTNPNIGMFYSSYDNGMPYGCAGESFTILNYQKVLEDIEKDNANEIKRFCLEHTKPAFEIKYPYLKKFNLVSLRSSLKDFKRNKFIPLSVDYPEDFLFVSYLANKLATKYGLNFSYKDFIKETYEIEERLFINKGLHKGFGE